MSADNKPAKPDGQKEQKPADRSGGSGQNQIGGDRGQQGGNRGNSGGGNQAAGNEGGGKQSGGTQGGSKQGGGNRSGQTGAGSPGNKEATTSGRADDSDDGKTARKHNQDEGVESS